MEDISAKVKAIIVDKLGVDENEVQDSASFTNDLGADSLDTVELIMEFEMISQKRSAQLVMQLNTSPRAFKNRQWIESS